MIYIFSWIWKILSYYLSKQAFFLFFSCPLGTLTYTWQLFPLGLVFHSWYSRLLDFVSHPWVLLRFLKCAHCLPLSITGVIFQFLKPPLFFSRLSSVILPVLVFWSYFRVLFISEAHLTVKVCVACLAFTGSALVCWWLLISFVGLIYASFWNTVQKSF